MKKSIVFSVCFMFICAFALVGCSSKDTEQDVTLGQDMKLIYEETVSPNKEYVESEEDVVNYSIEVYQDEDYKVLVNAKSNSEFFEPLQYELEYDQEITESDIAIEWTTLIGNSKATEHDQLAIAYVSISENGQVFSERKISFGNKAIEIIIDTINKD